MTANPGDGASINATENGLKWLDVKTAINDPLRFIESLGLPPLGSVSDILSTALTTLSRPEATRDLRDAPITSPNKPPINLTKMTADQIFCAVYDAVIYTGEIIGDHEDPQWETNLNVRDLNLITNLSESVETKGEANFKFYAFEEFPYFIDFDDLRSLQILFNLDKALRNFRGGNLDEALRWYSIASFVYVQLVTPELPNPISAIDKTRKGMLSKKGNAARSEIIMAEDVEIQAIVTEFLLTVAQEKRSSVTGQISGVWEAMRAANAFHRRHILI